MNVLFVIPCFPERIKDYLILPSIEICIMSTILKTTGHNVELLDMQINDYKIEDIDFWLSKYEPDYVCIEDMAQIHCCSKKVISSARRVYGNGVKICMRGEIPSFIPETILRRNKDLDIILRYETDYALLNVIQRVENKMSLADVPDIAYRNGEDIYVTARSSEMTDLSKLPKADRKLYDISKYLKRDSETIVKSSRGCVGNCVFCIKTKYERFHYFPMAYFCDELQELTSYGFKTFFFSDNVFASSMQRLYDFENELARRNLKVRWTSNIRIKDITEEKISLMKKLGAYRVFIGIETINASNSRLIKKDLSKDEIEKKIMILNKYDMEYHASFILGNPGDTEEDLEETIKFVKQIKPTLVTFNLLKVFPGLDIYDNYDKYDIIMDPYWYESDEWTHKVVMGTKQLPPDKLEYWSRRMLFEFMKT